MTSRSRLPVLVTLAALLLTACSADPASGPAPGTGQESSPPEIARGEVTAQLRQSSHDAARQRMQVWIQNDTTTDLDPTRIVFRDRRLGTPVDGERLRPIPAGSQRGYPLALPRRPACGAEAGTATLGVHEGGRRSAVPVEDPNDLVARHTASRCLEIEVTRVARLRWAEEVVRRGEGPDASAGLILVVEPTGRPGSFTIDEVNGTPVLAPVGAASWKPDVRVSAATGRQRVELEMIPARCDPHAFAESGGATSMRVHVTLKSGRTGNFVVPMSEAGARSALGFALETCGF